MRQSASCRPSTQQTGRNPGSSRGSDGSDDALRQASLVRRAAPLWPGRRFCEHRAGSSQPSAGTAQQHQASSSHLMPIRSQTVKLTHFLEDPNWVDLIESGDRRSHSSAETLEIVDRIRKRLLAGVALACTIATAWLVLCLRKPRRHRQHRHRWTITVDVQETRFRIAAARQCK